MSERFDISKYPEMLQQLTDYHQRNGSADAEGEARKDFANDALRYANDLTPEDIEYLKKIADGWRGGWLQ